MKKIKRLIVSTGRSPYLLLSALFLLSFTFSFAQSPAVVHVKKDRPLLFFQKGAKSDSIVKAKNDLFYLSVPDSLKNTLSILTENGRLEPISGDTLLRFDYLKGLRYESQFIKTENNTPPELKTLINGAADQANASVHIQLLDKKSGKILLENRFFYRPR